MVYYRKGVRMSEQELLLIFLGIIAFCMVIITAAIVFIAIQSARTRQKMDAFVSHLQNELSFISSKAAVTLHDVSELLTHLKGQTHTLGEKSMLTLHEVRNLVAYLHDETRTLALKASNGITKATLGTLAIGAFSQFLKKKPK